MKIHIIARGRIGRSPEGELVERYMKRLSWPYRITELPDRESAASLPPAPSHAMTIALDETGKAWRSLDFARKMGEWQDEGRSEIRFLIGAADGLREEERKAADMYFAFGPATWPHMLARAMLAEQLWRASAILTRHPYHREG
ncbi:MAG: 23S rRNA (pseudouridine(1915)-N(3))-methyltransferase RlmH [Zymomonas mobilis subsp. pomaceae]|uniref:Ribosomal RNA large subunit methyltransferase H n=1 Tax=Zymomonas mobilis subsp. pomaceae (strain ATCC 29192 / DSM 22645 / JCM 10191 / CCUG 17912 / NBRC 13757 / NCIMB 11200 / NRRL B-4491 / Barker I) TaxID=579138 RepID=F8EVK4_ZYMMT|nr:23S rRNA (pseudouridine(1915)-N(3))-methyltransferase RlmH [Zymomonas mobilis]AEI38341.1 protein of unknown function DUF163 [Zymomonas mobilis subsp. pomaceae ATCC 29192]MDX5948030.1 23S rRNA (pseudouridine(1915)-N(3))-methyltransferase RlmH [Zymomonas mobilis subsp. pomaceae]GEB89360.1 ribosomal RNA large subunit methyltransferase H [Zymomonas mobilis subsp. pomaceae]